MSKPEYKLFIYKSWHGDAEELEALMGRIKGNSNEYELVEFKDQILPNGEYVCVVTYFYYPPDKDADIKKEVINDI